MVLIATDQEAALEEIAALVGRRGYATWRGRTAAAALARARTTGADLIIMDEMFPDREALDVARALRAEPAIGPGTPILMTITGRAGPARHLDALRAGVWEFITWPMSEVELASKIDYYILAKLDADRDRANDPRDDATGLPGVTGLAHRAQQLALQAYHHHAPMACVVLSPDDPTTAPLVGRALAASGRSSDAIGRVATAEFAIVAAGTDARSAEQLAARLVSEVQRAIGEGGTTPSLRAGFHAVPNVHYSPVEPMSLLSKAGASLRRARESRDWIRGSELGD